MKTRLFSSMLKRSGQRQLSGNARRRAEVTTMSFLLLFGLCTSAIAAERGGRAPQNSSATPPFILETKRSGNFVLTSSAVKDGQELPKEFNGEGEGATLPLDWKGAPAGTKSFALVMDHLAKGPEMKCYWTLWDIPPTVTSLPKNVQGIGKLGATWKRGETYITPHSAGGGPKTYTLHLYALSKAPELPQPAGEVTREVLLTAIKDSILDSAELKVVYTPRGASDQRGPGGNGNPKKGARK